MQNTTLEELKSWRRHLHSNPELSNQEFETAKYIREELESMGLEYETPLPTATIAKIKGKGDKYIILRADIDALPINEQNDIDFKSNNNGVMHACGHDAHTTMLLGAVKELLALSKDNKLNINILAVFQPSEESFGGANLLIYKYDFDKYDIDSAYALHINPDFKEGTIASRVGPIMASCNEFDVNIKGKSAHVGIRETGINAINASIQVYNQFQTIPTYDLDSKHTNIVHIGYMKVGEVMNSVAENGHLEGTIRSYNMNDIEIIKDRMKKICKGVSISTGCLVDLVLREGYPAVLNSDRLIGLAQAAAKKSDAEFILIEEPYLLGEDFSFFSKLTEINYSFIGIRNESLGYTSGLHTPTLMLREEALVYGVDYLVEIALSFK